MEELPALLTRSPRELTPTQKEEQRRSFVYGNTKIENKTVTRKLVNEVAEKLAKDGR